MFPNRQVVSSMFADIFQKPENFLSLYNALTNQNLKLEETELKPSHLKDSIFKGLMNDVSMEINGKIVVLIEHQSTINMNMPLRCLMYIARMYEQLVPREKRYYSGLQKIPAPEFFVLYNGSDPMPEKVELRLSDAFKSDTGKSLELIVPVYNIGPEKNLNVQKKCNILEEYGLFVEKLKALRQNFSTSEEAVIQTVKYCLDNEILKTYLQEAGAEVFNMIMIDYDYEEHMAALKQEAIEQGIEQGIERGAAEKNLENAKKMQQLGISEEIIEKVTGIKIC